MLLLPRELLCDVVRYIQIPGACLESLLTKHLAKVNPYMEMSGSDRIDGDRISY